MARPPFCKSTETLPCAVPEALRAQPSPAAGSVVPLRRPQCLFPDLQDGKRTGRHLAASPAASAAVRRGRVFGGDQQDFARLAVECQRLCARHGLDVLLDRELRRPLLLDDRQCSVALRAETLPRPGIEHGAVAAPPIGRSARYFPLLASSITMACGCGRRRRGRDSWRRAPARHCRRPCRSGYRSWSPSWSRHRRLQRRPYPPRST